MGEIEIKTLGGMLLAGLADAWNKAFSDYAVKLHFDERLMGLIIRQNGVRLESSIGAVSGGDLIGIWLNGIRTIDGMLSAYDAGTAICPEFRSQGISKMLAAKSNEILRSLGVKKYVLEVLTENEKAFNLYKGQGFEVTRRFECLEIERPLAPVACSDKGISFEVLPLNAETTKLLPPTEYTPSWQNRIEAMIAISDDVELHAARKTGKIVGFGIVQPARGRISEIGFTEKYWGTDVSSAILTRLFSSIKGEAMMINIQEDADKTIGLLEGHGFKKAISQYEMKKLLV
jgi:ribosomal protein S18 acetylase RimI-like enzyme